MRGFQKAKLSYCQTYPYSRLIKPNLAYSRLPGYKMAIYIGYLVHMATSLVVVQSFALNTSEVSYTNSRAGYV